MTEKITAGFILETLKEWVEQKKLISKNDWLTIAGKLNLLQMDENSKLFSLQQEVAAKEINVYKVQEKKNLSAAKLEVKTTESWRQMKEQEARVNQIEQFIMIAKKQSEY